MKSSGLRRSPSRPQERRRDSTGARIPRQRRGQRRMDGLLDAAEALIAELGIDAVTTSAVAARAGASIGSLYYFFADKQAIVEAVARRFATLSCAITSAAARDDRHPPLGRVVRDLTSLLRARPAFSAVFDACCRPHYSSRGFRDMREVCVGQFSAVLAVRLPRMPSHERQRVATLIVTMVHGALRELPRVPRRQRSGMINELNRMIARYAAPLDAEYGRPATPLRERRQPSDSI